MLLSARLQTRQPTEGVAKEISRIFESIVKRQDAFLVKNLWGQEKNLWGMRKPCLSFSKTCLIYYLAVEGFLIMLACFLLT